MDLPIYKLSIDETDPESGLEFISIVDSPAIERSFQAFQDKGKLSFKISDESQRIVSGPFMVADLPIYRRDDIRGEHYVLFEKEAIRKIAYKFFKDNLNTSVNLQHQKQVDGVFLFESMLIDKERGILTPKGFDELPEGSWFGSYKVDNDDVWSQFISTGVFKGFSVEGIFSYPERPNEYASDEDIQSLIDEVNNFISGFGNNI